VETFRDITASINYAVGERGERPWGTWQVLDAGAGYAVKRIVVFPGKKLSLQRHNHRAEHWVVVSGTAKVLRGDEAFIIAENENTYLPLGCVHRLENPGLIPLVVIEVQTGSYLSEDDIVRLDDDYGRI
jgi:mannose-6-phosphate isomerase-like protein (cupin superfamily)